MTHACQQSNSVWFFFVQVVTRPLSSSPRQPSTVQAPWQDGSREASTHQKQPLWQVLRLEDVLLPRAISASAGHPQAQQAPSTPVSPGCQLDATLHQVAATVGCCIEQAPHKTAGSSTVAATCPSGNAVAAAEGAAAAANACSTLCGSDVTIGKLTAVAEPSEQKLALGMLTSHYTNSRSSSSSSDDGLTMDPRQLSGFMQQLASPKPQSPQLPLVPMAQQPNLGGLGQQLQTGAAEAAHADHHLPIHSGVDPTVLQAAVDPSAARQAVVDAAAAPAPSAAAQTITAQADTSEVANNAKDTGQNISRWRYIRPSLEQKLLRATVT